jgi:hypothetical protein
MAAKLYFEGRKHKCEKKSERRERMFLKVKQKSEQQEIRYNLHHNVTVAAPSRRLLARAQRNVTIIIVDQHKRYTIRTFAKLSPDTPG